MDRASICGSVQLVILLSGSRVLESLCHPQRLLVLELLCWGSRGPPSLGGMLRLSDGCEVWALDGGRAGHFLGLLAPKLSLEKRSRAPTPRIRGERGRLRGLEHSSRC